MNNPNEPPDKPWQGRFSEPTDAFVEAFTASVDFDRRLYKHDILGSLAHARMLAQCGVLTALEAQQITTGLEQVRQEIESGQFRWSIRLEDVHMNIESRLTELIGDAGKKLHTGRSRNDQVATDLRLWLKDEIKHIAPELLRLQTSIVDLAYAEQNTWMPGFTHLQTAQPICFGHHLLAWYEMLTRDLGRLSDCEKRVDCMPLGAAALAGTSYPIDREYTARLLGFSTIAQNSLDAVSDRDFAIEFSAFAALLLMHLSRMAEELILWNSAQFAFVKLPDRFCTGSSIMPQKKNPDVPELVRGKTGRVYGNLMSLLTLMKGQPLAYNKDNQEDKEPLFDTVDTVKACVRAFADLIAHLEPNRPVMAEAARSGYSTATDLADYLVRKQIPFRQAHEIVGKIVAFAVQKNSALDELALDELQRFDPNIDQDVYLAISLEGSVNARNHTGGTAPQQVRLQVENARKAIAAAQNNLNLVHPRN